MAIATGTTLGPYEVGVPLGAGGMGEVYRARDTDLGREVALKVLPQAFASDPERMARFQREAQVLASLNHPNIASIYGFDDSAGVRALVMELVEGPTLAARIDLGGIPLDEALMIARQICDAMEYAHERGIVHRDLKPANIKITSEDSVKVLDFGLAKAVQGDAKAQTDSSASPTLTGMATQHGIILGTAAYMSPEQAKGRPVDRRADIWSFGCILFEMLTGHLAFHGETVTDTMAAVLREEPDWALLSANTPPRIRELLLRCLKKDAKQRLQSIGDARIAIDETISGAGPFLPGIAPPASPPPVALWRRSLPWTLLTLCSLIAAILALAYLHRREPPLPSMRLTIAAPPDAQLGTAMALSPDGSRLVFVATVNGKQSLWIRLLDSLQAQPIPGTEGGDFPFWSPDSKSVGFFTNNKLKRWDSASGAVTNLCNVGNARGGAWSHDGTIVFAAEVNKPLMKIAASGGTPVPATAFDTSRQDRSHRWPCFLPDGQRFIFLEEGNSQAPDVIAVGSLDSTKTQMLFTLPAGSAATYASGHLLYSSGGALVAQAFDPDDLKTIGNPIKLAENVSAFDMLGPTGYVPVTASATGLLIYRTDVPMSSQLTVVDRSGNTVRTIGPPGGYIEPTLSPDQKQIAVAMPDPGSPGADSIWLIDVATAAFSRFTTDSASNGDPEWSPDGRWIYFSSNRGGDYNLYRKLADGSADAELVFKTPNVSGPSDISQDNRILLYGEFAPSTGLNILYLPLEGQPMPKVFIATPATEMAGKFSPDARWVTYDSDENHPGDFEVFVAPFPSAVNKRQLSSNGGHWPTWSGDGKEIFFISGNDMMAAEVVPGPTFQFRPPHSLFKVRPPENFLNGAHADFSVFPDRQKFLLNQSVSTGESPPMTVIANWTTELKKK